VLCVAVEIVIKEWKSHFERVARSFKEECVVKDSIYDVVLKPSIAEEIAHKAQASPPVTDLALRDGTRAVDPDADGAFSVFLSPRFM
jgi:hypothetical protein